jgi:hypothetical protein
MPSGSQDHGGLAHVRSIEGATMFGTMAIAATVACVAFAETAVSQRVPEAMPFRVTERALDIRVDYERGSLSGTETLHLRNIGSRATRDVPLLLNRLMSVTRVSDAARAKVPFRQNVVLFEDDSTLQVDAVIATLAHPVQPGDSATLVVQYGGHLVGYTETGSLYIKDRVDSAFTIIRQDAFAFPVSGVPSRKVNRAAGYDPFAFAIRVTVPAGFVVAAGGKSLEPERHDSLVTWSYRSTAPTSALNITIARYRVIDRPGLHVFYFAEDSLGARMIDRAVAGAMAAYTEWYGPLDGASRLTVIEIPEGFGSQASLAGGIIQTADAFRDKNQLYQLYHELSHLWNVEDLDRPSPRWNEGLAMFLQWRMAARLDGWSAWDAALDRAERRLKSDCHAPTACNAVPFKAFGKEEMTGLSYSAGMIMFYALYKTLGAELFDSTYRTFFQKHRASGATSADMLAAFDAASPASDRVVDDWFLTTRWYARLTAGESVRHIVDEYAKP